MAMSTALLLLSEHYGDTLADVLGYLMKKGRMPMKPIAQESGLDILQVKKSLAVGIQHGFVTYERHKRGFLEYSAQPAPALLILRYPRYIACAKSLYGDIAELLVEETLQQGQATVAQLLPRVLQRFNESPAGGQKATIGHVRDKFVNLVQTHFLERCPDAVVGSDSKISDEQPSPFEVPRAELDSIVAKSTFDQEPPAKKQRTANAAAAPVLSSWWRVSFHRFHQHMRDQAVIAACASKFGKPASDVLRTMLRLSEVKTHPESMISDSLSSNEIFQALPKELGMKRSTMDQHLTVLAEDSTSFATKAGDSGGGNYVINFYKLLSSICAAHVESIVQERFGSKSLRVFRVLRLKQHLEQKPIEDFCLIPSKEAKDMMYAMFAESFLPLTELARTSDHAPSRTLYLFNVVLERLARNCIDHCAKAIFNMIVKRKSLLEEHRRLLDKQQKVDAIVATLEQSGADDKQKEEVQEMITPSEREQIASIKTMANRLEQAELQLDETLFVMELFLTYAVKSRTKGS